MTSSNQADRHGFAAQHRDLEVLLKSKKIKESTPVMTVAMLPRPDTALVNAAFDYAKRELDEQTFNHSMRVYYFGRMIQQTYFPEWDLTAETYFLACALHDIGTAHQNMTSTHLSFEFHGAFIAHSFLLGQLRAPKDQAEAVAEAIIRHQDIGDAGKITTLGALIQLSTLLDNIGANSELVSKETIEDVVKHFPRNGWSNCFASVVRKEIALKPWANSTRLGEEEFPSSVEGNKVMAEYD